jgi:hypothetical protein
MEKTIEGEVSRSVFLKEILKPEDFIECEKHGNIKHTKSIDFYQSELNSEQSFFHIRPFIFLISASS